MEASGQPFRDMDIGKTIAFSFFLHSLALSAGVLSVTHVPLQEKVFMVKIERREDRRTIIEQGDHAEHMAREERKQPGPVKRSLDQVNLSPEKPRDLTVFRDARQTETALALPSGTLPGQEKGQASEREKEMTSLAVGGQTGNTIVQATGGTGTSLYDQARQSPASRGPQGGDENNIRRIQELIERTKIYPQLARKRRQQGTAVVRFSIDTKGLPLDINILRSSGFTLLDSAARDIITRAAPFPYVKGAIEVPITFRLRDED